ncbi:MAG TPA: hypothetical protein VN920_15785 [Pyrinomonadaceae bacterium]|nr:hypothetical protein [Pyrinomonadaceae bacterium]
MLHIHNGESSANTLKESTIHGKQFAFRDALVAGPTPAQVQGEDWRRLRAAHLAESYGVNREECELDLLRQEEILSIYADQDEVVLWFEHDLFCQVNLIYLLDWFNRRDLEKTKLSLICIGKFTGVNNFRGLGELNAEQLTALFDLRHEVTTAEMKLASAAWSAYRAPDPTAIERFLSHDTSALPFLRDAFHCHLARFPSLRNGLGRVENRGLELIDRGLDRFADLFTQFGVTEPIYGLGDFQFWLVLKQLGAVQMPLLTFENGENPSGALDSAKLRDTRFELTPQGKVVLKGEADFVEMNGLDEWLGGVHLSADQLWRWDEANEKIVLG